MDCVGGVAAASAAAYSVQLEGLLAFRKSVTTDPLVALSVHRSSNAARALHRGVRQRCLRALPWCPPARRQVLPLRWPKRSVLASSSAIGKLSHCVCQCCRRALSLRLPARSAVTSAQRQDARRRRALALRLPARSAVASAQCRTRAAGKLCPLPSFVVASARRQDAHRLASDAAQRTYGPCELEASSRAH
jgi:hypothetical protein